MFVINTYIYNWWKTSNRFVTQQINLQRTRPQGLTSTTYDILHALMKNFNKVTFFSKKPLQRSFKIEINF